jgi:hypothetical protein
VNPKLRFMVAAMFVPTIALANDWPAIHGNLDHTGVTSEQLTLPLSLSWVTQADQAPSPAFYKGLAPDGSANNRTFRTEPVCHDFVYQTVIVSPNDSV